MAPSSRTCDPSGLKRPRYTHTVIEVPSSDEDDCDLAGKYHDTAHTFTHYGSQTQSGLARTWGGVVPVRTSSHHIDPVPHSISTNDTLQPESGMAEESNDFATHLLDNEDSDSLEDEGDDAGLLGSDGKRKRPLRPSVCDNSQVKLCGANDTTL